MTAAADVKAAEAAAAHAWAILDAIRDECLGLIRANKKQRQLLIAAGKDADPMARAVVIAVASVLERISHVATQAMVNGGVG